MDGVSFAVRVTNHSDAENTLLTALSQHSSVETTKTDYGYTGTFDGSADTLREVCDANTSVIRTLCFAYTENGEAHGVACEVDESGVLVSERTSRNNNPETWHGLVYDGLRVRAP